MFSRPLGASFLFLTSTIFSACTLANVSNSNDGDSEDTTANVDVVYPKAPRKEKVDTYYGFQVSDPYQGMEDLTAADTRSWVKAESQLAEQWLTALPHREKISHFLNQLVNRKRIGLPERHGGREFREVGGEGANRDKLVWRATTNSPDKILLDGDKIYSETKKSLTEWSISPSGKKVVYFLSKDNNDDVEYHIIDVDTQASSDLGIVEPVMPGIAWNGEKGIYHIHTNDDKSRSGYYVDLNGGAKGKEVFPAVPAGQNVYVYSSDDEKYVFFNKGDFNNREILYGKTDSSSPSWTHLWSGNGQARATHYKGFFYLNVTSNEKPDGIIYRMPEASVATQNIIVESIANGVIYRDFAIAKDRLLVHARINGVQTLRIYNLQDGSSLGELASPMPMDMSISASTDSEQDGVVYVERNTFHKPPENLKFDIITTKTQVIDQ